MSKGKLFCGPWVGEFGWELFCWQGYLRAISRHYDYITICCRTDHDYLYADFADDYIEFNPQSGETNMWMCGGVDYGGIYDAPEADEDTTILNPIELWELLDKSYKTGFAALKPHKYIPFGHKSKKNAFDFVFHARATAKVGSAVRNWPIDKWFQFSAELKDNSLACIGSPDAAYYVEGTNDLRGLPLRELSNILASSKMLIGPSSGPMHLGSLCGIPHLVWSGALKSVRRYNQEWNPFKTPVVVMTEKGWNPEVRQVLSEIGFLKFIIKNGLL